MTRFEPFRAIRFASAGHLDKVVIPPADTLGKADIERLRELDEHSLAWAHFPAGGKREYDVAAYRLTEWENGSILDQEAVPSLTIYRIAYRNELGAPRQLSGVLGALELDDDAIQFAEQPKQVDVTDQLELLKASGIELEPTWVMADAKGLQDALLESGELLGTVDYSGVVHSIERVTDPDRIKQISKIISRSQLTLAAGQQSYQTALAYREAVRKATGSKNTPAEFTLAFVSDLNEQSVETLAAHRFVDGMSNAALHRHLSGCFELEPMTEPITRRTLNEMVALNRLVLVDPSGKGTWLKPRVGAFTGVADLDSAWLEHAFAGSPAEFNVMPDLSRLMDRVKDHKGAILVRPVTEDFADALNDGPLPADTVALAPRPYAGFALRPTAKLVDRD